MGRFRCLKDQTCIPLHKRCNGIKDCTDGWDEDAAICGMYHNDSYYLDRQAYANS